MIPARRILPVLLAALFAFPSAARGRDEFAPFRDSFRNSFREDALPEDRLATIEGIATFNSREAVELMISAIPIEMKVITALIAERDKIQGGDAKALEGRLADPHLVAIKAKLDAEYKVIEAIEKGLAKLRNSEAIAYLARDVLPKSKEWKAREIAARALGRIGDRSQLKFILRCLSEKDARVRTAIVGALAAMRAEEALPDLVKMLSDKDWMTRSAVIDALGLIRDPRAFEALLARMREEKGRLAEDCADALEKITGQRFGRSVSAWEKWWADHKDRALAGERFDLPPEPEKPEADKPYYHGLPMKTNRTVFIIDVSESMSYSQREFQEKPKEGEPSRLDLAKREMIQAIKQYDPKGHFGIVAFHSVVVAWRPRVVPASPPMREDAVAWIQALEPIGTTNIYGALEAAFSMAGMGLSDKYYEPSVDTIFLLSDGAPTNEDLTEDDPDRILRAVREWNSLGRIRIHTVGLKGHSASFMSALAKQNGGTYIARD